MRLDRFICKHSEHLHQTCRLLIASGHVQVDGEVVRDPSLEVGQFMTVSLDGRVLQQQSAHYLMLHKPVGYLSATKDPVHPTALELIDSNLRPLLHIGGRLDRSTSGLLILSNDGRWSRRLTEPKLKVPKVYHVHTADPICSQTARRFAEGIYFAYEDLTTSPSQIEQLADCEAKLTIFEGRYHQVKRMFAAVGNRVTALHREQMGSIRLDASLAPGQSRTLSATEILSV